MGADGKPYAIPFTTDTFAMIYNKDLLKAAGYDKSPDSWDELRKASQAVKEKTGKAGWGFPAGTCGTPTIWFLTNFYIWSKGWAFVDQQPNGGKYLRQHHAGPDRRSFRLLQELSGPGPQPQVQSLHLPVGCA